VTLYIRIISCNKSHARHIRNQYNIHALLHGLFIGPLFLEAYSKPSLNFSSRIAAIWFLCAVLYPVCIFTSCLTRIILLIDYEKLLFSLSAYLIGSRISLALF